MIQFSKSMTTPAGLVVSHHRVHKADVSADGQRINVLGRSWASQEVAAQGTPPAENWACSIPLFSLAGQCANLIDAIADWLLTFGPMQGGARLPEAQATLDDAKALKWAEVKSWRDRVEYGGFAWDGSTFDSDEQSRARIQGSVQLALLAATAGEAFSVDWILADNSVRTLDGAQMIAVGQALGAHVMAAFEAARLLREQVDAASTVEEVQAISVPVA